MEIFVAVYEHPHGTDVRAFSSDARAYEWRTALAKEWWEHEIDDVAPADDVIGQEYFDRISDEYFCVHRCTLE